MPTDIDIAQAASLQKILPLAHAKLGLPEDSLSPYGHYKAKLSLGQVQSLGTEPNGHLVLVTAISPTPPGEGKTTTTVGLGDGLNLIGKQAMICLREPSLGPCFGMKGGAAGGGRAQVLPMEDINLHFTGDFHAIALANNLLAALIDNHIHHGNALKLDVRRISWRRVVDMNDRALRDITVALGGPGNGYPRQDGFDIVVASEVMAILCLATSLADLQRRLGNIVVGTTADKKPVTARELKADGAMTALLKDALAPNLVQTLEGNLAFVHGGPFANIAHGCNSVIATQTALKLADYVVTEAGFGADLGAEKIMSIKCRKAGLNPSCAVLVATVRALKFHGHGDDLAALERGLANLRRHIENIRQHYELPLVVSINRFDADSPEEIALIQAACQALGVACVLATHWAEGGAGAAELARQVVALCEANASRAAQPAAQMYRDEDPLADKIRAVAAKIYRAEEVQFEGRTLAQLQEWQDAGWGHLPVCIAKTPYSFSSDPTLRGAATGHTLRVRELRLNAGAEFIVAICGDIMTMPGLPKVPAAEHIGVDAAGRISGLF
ncbi:formate--tetrahydrofolate ligase [Paucibacter sp. KCTC 42545]|uniref:formate--tetrahydrofolate ligase n=1 Tax=Paucibacter sp. KCTC 42545 TaxID=1768242 RepID=UPI000733AD34|nr:formate--tetrahydrofolate ligase [Paucibacter sp. KCTC 42545]ALT77240.1 formate--tetrahydrofolate ligase [Paucibacter sp. KCTC 42545]